MTRLLVLVPIVLALPLTGVAQQQPTAAQMEAMLEKTRPGPEHRALEGLVGQWRQDVTFDMGGQGRIVFRGTATNRLILGGRFLVSERTAENTAGPAFGEKTIAGLNIYGFDRRTGEYTILELDTMGTYWVSAAGGRTPAGEILMSGESLDDHGGARQMRKFDMVLKIVDADTYVTQIIFKLAGRPDLKIAETVSRRVK